MSAIAQSISSDDTTSGSMSLMQLVNRSKLTDAHEGVSVTTAAVMARNRIPMLKTQIIGETSKVLSMLMESKDMTHDKKTDIASILSKVITMVAAIDDAANAETMNLMTDFPAMDAKINVDHLQKMFASGIILTSDFKKFYNSIVTAEILLRRKNERFVEANALTFPIPVTPDPGIMTEDELRSTMQLFTPFFERHDLPLDRSLLVDLTVIKHAGNNKALNRYASLTMLGKNALAFATHFESDSAAESLYTVAERVKLYLCDSALEESAVTSGLHSVLTINELEYGNYANVVRAFVAAVVKFSGYKQFDKLNVMFKWYGEDAVKYIIGKC